MEPPIPKDVTVPTHGVPSHLEQHEDADESCALFAVRRHCCALRCCRSATVKRLLVQDQLDYADRTHRLTLDT